MTTATRARIALLCTCAVLTSASPTSAQMRDATYRSRDYRRSSAILYRQVGAPNELRARELLRQTVYALHEAAQALPGDYRSLCLRALGPVLGRADTAHTEGRLRALAALAHQALARRALVDAALARIDAALELTPRDSDLLYARARALSLWEEPRAGSDCSIRRKDDEAARALEALIAADPGYDSMQTAFELGVVRTRLHDFAGAADAYQRAIELAFSERDTAVARANLAEVTMLGGDPAAALPHYQRAIALSSSGRDYALALLGKAVALDRLGEHGSAIDDAKKAAETSGRSLAVLEGEGVFFEPEYERHYYRALGHEALAALTPETGAILLETARAEYQAFIAEAPPSELYRSAAQANLDAITRVLAVQAKKDARVLDALSKKPKPKPAPR